MVDYWGLKTRTKGHGRPSGLWKSLGGSLNFGVLILTKNPKRHLFSGIFFRFSSDDISCFYPVYSIKEAFFTQSNKEAKMAGNGSFFADAWRNHQFPQAVFNGPSGALPPKDTSGYAHGLNAQVHNISFHVIDRINGDSNHRDGKTLIFYPIHSGRCQDQL